MKRLTHALRRARIPTMREMLEDGLWVLRQLPGVGVREISFKVRSPDLLALGNSPVVAEVKKGRLLARTQRKDGRKGGLLLTFQWETAANAPRRKPAPMPLAEFLRSLEAA